MPVKTRPTIEQALRRLSVPFRRWMTDDYGIQRNSCVMMARIIDLTIRDLGLGKPQIIPVEFIISNAKMTELAAEHGVPDDEATYRAWFDAGAYCLQIDTEAPYSESSFPGHLIVRVGNWLCDPSLDQAARPERGIDPENWVIPIPENWTGKADRGELARVFDDGGAIAYRVLDMDPAAWLNSPDWIGVAGDTFIRQVAVMYALGEIT